MARSELKPSTKILWDEHRTIETKLTSLKDVGAKLAEDIAKLRQQEFAHKEAGDTLPKTAAFTAARQVLKREIDAVRLQIKDKSILWEANEKELQANYVNLKNIKASIKALESA